ncbi:MAG: transcription elongation factor GreA [Patescibacteria group bacterium]
MTNIILTEEGKKKLEVELKELKEVRRPEIIEKIAQAKELGDLSENAEYHDAKDQQGLAETRISEIEDVLRKAIISDGITSINCISLGSKFIVEQEGCAAKELTIVGYNEAEPAQGKISNESPLGKAFMGKTTGDKVNIIVPKGATSYKIIKIL